MHKLECQNFKKTLIVSLNHMESHNAFDIDMAEELSLLLKNEKLKALVLTNKGSSFCAGGNLKFYSQLKTKEEGLEVNQRITEILNDLYELKIPKSCFVNGPCYGGGVELISCFDHIVASPHSLFGLWQRRIGLSFGWGGGKRLLTKMSEAHIKRWLFEASTFSAYQAQDMGLVNSVSISSKGIDDCLKWAEKTHEQGEQSFQETKSVFDNEEQAFKNLWHSEKHKSALDKFK